MIKKAIIASLAVALTLAPVASAEGVDEFITDVRDTGVSVTSENEAEIVAVGLGVCVDLFNGFSINEEYAQMRSVGISDRVAQEFLAVVISDLCPNAVRGGNLGGAQ